MDNKSNKNNKNNSQIIQKEDNSHYERNGVYLRDDHCDWGSSGMNEFTNEYNSN